MKYFKSSYKALLLLDKSCLSFSQLKQIQDHLIVSGTIGDPFAAGKLLSGFAISDNKYLEHAYALFRILPRRSTYACGELCDVSIGFMYHGLVVKLGLESYDFVQNGLVHLYSACEHVGLARKLFNGSGICDVVTWTALINGYMRCGKTELARELFDEMPEKNAVSWSMMIGGYVQAGLCKEALELFNDMQFAGIRPNHASIVGALSASASLGALDQGRWIHAFVNRYKMPIDGTLGTALIDMYAKSGVIDMAYRVFEEMSHRDVFAYTSLICGLANNGENMEALKLFRRMENAGIRPNEVTFIGVLNASKQIGLVQEGLRIFESMKQVYGIQPMIQHYGCLVDLLGRAGMLEHARSILREMPMEPDAFVLGALLNASAVHGDINLGEEVVKEMSDQSLDHNGVPVLLSNMYASINNWDNVESVRKIMEEKAVKKVTGCSLIEVFGVTSEFAAGDRSHVHIKEIDLISLSINNHLKSSEADDCDLYIEQLYS